MLISDYIASVIEEMLNEGGGTTEVKRNDLASRLGCVPSQINYVITSRFTPEKGYIIESKRGGGGYIRIVRAQMTKNEYLMHFFHAISDGLDVQNASAFIVNLYDRGFITEREAVLLRSTLCGSALDRVHPAERNSVRADIMRHIILTLMN
ncbi:MAG: CtsR family transcriptional regulator [Clostridia bacterium]|nr:CtsR family transcriptional regulator [Clostridia bacterium]MBR5632669.1 CtsR family transcriptional regulator [Clostridia bacterium]